jgi:hypothetical protein
MIAAGGINQDLIIQASSFMIEQDDLLFPGLFELTNIVFFKINNRDGVGFRGVMRH